MFHLWVTCYSFPPPNRIYRNITIKGIDAISSELESILFCLYLHLKFLITWVKGNNAVHKPLYQVNGSILEAEEIFLVNINLLAATSSLESDLDFFQIETGIMKMLIGPGGQSNCANRLVTWKYQWKILLTHLCK